MSTSRKYLGLQELMRLPNKHDVISQLLDS